MTQINILAGTGTHASDAIMRGVFGSLDAAGKFVPDQQFQRISYLFTLHNGQAPAQEGDMAPHIVTLDVPDGLKSDVEATLVALCGQRWDEHYANVMSSQPPLVRNMLAAERSNVAGNVAAFQMQRGTQAYKVPVACACDRFTGLLYVTDSEAALVAHIAKGGGNITVPEGAQATPSMTQTEQAALANAVAAPAQEDQPAASRLSTYDQLRAQTQPAGLDDEHEHEDEFMQLVVSGSITVRAASEQAAIEVARQMASFANQTPQMSMHEVGVAPTHIVSFSLQEHEHFADAMESGHNERPRG